MRVKVVINVARTKPDGMITFGQNSYGYQWPLDQRQEGGGVRDRGLGVVCGLLMQARLRGLVRAADVETRNVSFWARYPDAVKSVDLVGVLTPERAAEPLFCPTNKAGKLVLCSVRGEPTVLRASSVRDDVRRFCRLFHLPPPLVSPKSFRQGFACSVMRLLLEAMEPGTTVSLQNIQEGCQASAQWRCMRQAMAYAR